MQDPTPSVTVIVPIFNQEDCMEECLDSIISQSLEDIEILCINDGSTDGSLDILRSYEAKDARVRVINKANEGVGASRNRGIQEAGGEYVIFCDPDDRYPDDSALKKLHTAAADNDAVIAGGSFSDVNPASGSICVEYDGLLAGYTFHQDGWVEYADYQFDYGFHRFLFKRDFLIRKNLVFPNYKRFQDPPFLVRALFAAERFYAIKDITYLYTFNNAKTTWTSEKIIDLAKGIRDNLAFSAVHGLNALHSLTVGRFLMDFEELFLDDPDDPCNLAAAAAISGNIEYDMLSAEQQKRITSVNGLMALKPLELHHESYLHALDEIATLKNELAHRDAMIADIKNSRSFKIGLAATALPRHIKRMMRTRSAT